MRSSQQFMTGEAMARVVDAGGEDIFIPYGREEIVGEYDFDVQVGSTQPMNDTIRRQQAVSLLNAVAPLVGAAIDPAALARHVLKLVSGSKTPTSSLWDKDRSRNQARSPVAVQCPRRERQCRLEWAAHQSLRPQKERSLRLEGCLLSC